LTHYRTAKQHDGFQPHPALEALAQKARSAGPDLRVIEGSAAAANVIDFDPTPEDRIGFKDIAGMETLKKILRLQIIEPFVNPGIFTRFKKKAGGGILLYGPPGAAKP
jgi:transitional endoplasmic reticulum ATPase